MQVSTARSQADMSRTSQSQWHQWHRWHWSQILKVLRAQQLKKPTLINSWLEKSPSCFLFCLVWFTSAVNSQSVINKRCYGEFLICFKEWRPGIHKGPSTVTFIIDLGFPQVRPWASALSTLLSMPVKTQAQISSLTYGEMVVGQKMTEKI